MRISRERLQTEATTTQFRPEVLEKAIHLLDLLNGFRSHPFLCDKFVLKGGTALNMFASTRGSPDRCWPTSPHRGGVRFRCRRYEESSAGPIRLSSVPR